MKKTSTQKKNTGNNNNIGNSGIIPLIKSYHLFH